MQVAASGLKRTANRRVRTILFQSSVFFRLQGVFSAANLVYPAHAARGMELFIPIWTLTISLSIVRLKACHGLGKML